MTTPRVAAAMTSERATLTSALVQRATDGLIAGFTEELAREHEREALRLGDLVRQLLIRAYQEGVRDGFVQGSQAQAISGASREEQAK